MYIEVIPMSESSSVIRVCPCILLELNKIVMLFKFEAAGCHLPQKRMIMLQGKKETRVPEARQIGKAESGRGFNEPSLRNGLFNWRLTTRSYLAYSDLSRRTTYP